eukprot:41627-Eustigmatos_ZCMA.PRE.1
MQGDLLNYIAVEKLRHVRPLCMGTWVYSLAHDGQSANILPAKWKTPDTFQDGPVTPPLIVFMLDPMDNAAVLSIDNRHIGLKTCSFPCPYQSMLIGVHQTRERAGWVELPGHRMLRPGRNVYCCAVPPLSSVQEHTCIVARYHHKTGGVEVGC